MQHAESLTVPEPVMSYLVSFFDAEGLLAFSATCRAMHLRYGVSACQRIFHAKYLRWYEKITQYHRALAGIDDVIQ